MCRCTFEIKKTGNKYFSLHAVKHCKYPKRTKIYKHLCNLLDKEIITEFKYYFNYE